MGCGTGHGRARARETRERERELEKEKRESESWDLGAASLGDLCVCSPVIRGHWLNVGEGGSLLGLLPRYKSLL